MADFIKSQKGKFSSKAEIYDFDIQEYINSLPAESFVIYPDALIYEKRNIPKGESVIIASEAKDGLCDLTLYIKGTPFTLKSGLGFFTHKKNGNSILYFVSPDGKIDLAGENAVYFSAKEIYEFKLCTREDVGFEPKNLEKFASFRQRAMQLLNEPMNLYTLEEFFRLKEDIMNLEEDEEYLKYLEDMSINDLLAYLELSVIQE